MPPLGRENFGGSVRVTKISRSHRPALAPPGVARRSPPTRIGRPEVKTNQCFSQNGAQRSSCRGTPKVAGRRAGVTFPPAACSRSTPTAHRPGYRCGVARTTSTVDCVGSTTALRSRRAVGFGGLGALSLGYGPDHVAEDAAALRADFSVLGHDIRASRENASGEHLRIHHRLCPRRVHHRNRIPCSAAARSTRP